ncbi:MAG TPA: GNAT family N-acetyltransferase [Dongiaceae bacterium]|nr:GNAT family N-acetyltransferase [Dongiaceae bacterium]
MIPPIYIGSGSKHELARLCLANRLYTPGGYMKYQYERMAEDKEFARHRRLIVLHYHDVLAGAILGSGKYIMVFVSPKWRRCGVGTALINSYVKKYRVKRSELEALTGTKGSGAMYFANGVRRASSVLAFVEAFGFRVTIPLKHQPKRGRAA